MLKKGPYNIECKPEYQCHNAYKRRNRRVLSRKKAIYRTAAFMLAAFARTHNGFSAYFFYKRKAHICDCGGAVKTAFAFHLQNNMFDKFGFICGKCQRLGNKGVALYQFACRKPYGYLRRGGMVLYSMHYTVYCPVNSTACVIPAAKISAFRLFAVCRNMNGMVHKFFYSFALCCGNRDYGNSEPAFKFVYVNGSAVTAYLVHHIKSKNHRNVKFHKLHCKVQVALYICGVCNIYNRRRFLV